MSRNIVTTHYISSVERRSDGELRDLHKNVIGQQCVPLSIAVYRRSLIAVERADYPGEIHRLHTSIVKSIDVDEQNRITITTENTIYTLVPVPVKERKEFVVDWGEANDLFR